MFKTSSTAGPLPTIAKLDALARTSGLIIRNSPKFSAHGFLLSMIQSVVQGHSSLNHIALRLGQFEPSSMSRQAMHQRFGDASSHYLISVLEELIKSRSQSLIPVKATLPFQRLLIEDCTVLPVHQSNHESFPGNGNRHHHTAGAKIHLLADWLSGDVLESGLHAARSADQGLAANILNHCKPCDLIIRDMGFFHLGTFGEIESCNAFWISRLPATTTAYDTQGVPLEVRLKREKRRQVEMVIYLGKHRQTKCRLIATRFSKQQAEKNRRERHRKSKRHGTTAHQRGLIRDDWHILVTNLTREQASPKLLKDLYSLRWSIEIQFRAFKQSINIASTLGHRTDHYHLEALVLAAMIYQIITLKLHTSCQRRSNREKPKLVVSYEKLCDAIAHHLVTLTRNTLELLFDPDPRHLQHDRRKRPTLYTTGVQSLT